MADKSDNKKVSPSKIPKPPIGVFVTPKSIFKPKPETESKEPNLVFDKLVPMNSDDFANMIYGDDKPKPDVSWADDDDDDNSPPLTDDDEPAPSIDKPMKEFVNKISKYIDGSSNSKSIYDDYMSYSDSKKPKDNSPVELTTDGLSYDDVKKFVYLQKNSTNGIKQCNMCTKYYPEMVTADQFDGGTTCWHCLFFLNSDDMSRIEDMYQISLESYVEFCGPSHNPENCIRADSCMLCLSNNNVPAQVRWEDPNKIDQFIDNIKNDVIDNRLDGEIDFGVSI
jgi:hypothetical protein